MSELVKTHYTVAELAQMRLPNFPTTAQGWRNAAESSDWPHREIKSRGRGGIKREYQPPAEVLRIIRNRAAESIVSSASAPCPEPLVSCAAGVPAPAASFSDNLTDRQRLERDARKGVLTALGSIQRHAGCSQEAAITTLLTNARAGTIEPTLDRMLRLARDPRGRAGDGYPSSRTLKRWLSAGDLAPKAPQKDMKVPVWAKAFLSYYQRPEKPSVQAAYDQFARETTGPVPSIHQARNFLKKLGAVTRERGRMGDRELKNIRPFVRRTFEHLEPNDVWTADGHTFDAEVQHPMHGRPFRPEITTFIDIATRRAVGWSVDLAESSSAVADALRNGVERYGIPAIIYVDNGSGYKNAFMGDAATGLVGRIGSEMTHSLPYNSQARGVIERSHQTIWVAGAKELPGFIGAHMDREARLEQFKLSRRALKSGGAMPLMPWHLFVQWCEQRIAWYNARAHRSLKGLSPALSWANFEAKGWQAHTMAAAELETLFRPRVTRTLARAEITLFNNIYFARELEEFHGAEVHVAYDIHDVSAVWIYLPDGRFICRAEVNGNAKHYFPVPVVEQARQKRAKGRLARVDVKREEILAELHGAEALPAPGMAPMVIGGRIVEARDIDADPVTDTPATPELTAKVTTIAAHEPAPVPRSERSAADNYADWLAIDAAIDRDDPVSEADARWHASYPRSAQYKAHVRRLDADDIRSA